MSGGSYYVPDQSRFPIFMAFSLFVLVMGASSTINNLDDPTSNSVYILYSGFACLFLTMFFWFRQVIKEHLAGLDSNQLKQSYVYGMAWFIFSEVMFFAAFFGALFYVRAFVVDWIGGVGGRGPSDMLWQDYEPVWPMMTPPDPEKFPGPNELISPWGLPLINTLLLVTSSFTVTFAHHGINEGNRKKLVNWLIATIALGVVFLFVQGYEYYHAYVDLGLTLASGIYGTTFFMLTGFHGAHVTLGTFMLIVMLFRSRRGHFTKTDCFGFEAAAWYWHFVDVVWLGLFVFVYVLGS